MSDLETKIKELQRQVELKNAYLSVQFSFPKNKKVPQDVAEEVFNKLKELSVSFADGASVVQSNESQFTDEEVKMLKLVASAASVSTQKSSTPAPINTPRAIRPPLSPSETIEKTATLLTLDHVQANVRSKMGSNEKVYVKSMKGDKAFVINQAGQAFNVPLDDLQME